MAELLEKGVPGPELAPQPETGRETLGEVERPRDNFNVQEKISETVQPTPVASSITAPASAPVADPTVKALELILSEDLLEHFKAMSPDVQAKFKQKGEEAVSRLSGLMQKTAIKAKEVLSIIVGWLKFIPGVSKYFLEQESKIKTDKILELYKRNHGG